MLKHIVLRLLPFECGNWLKSLGPRHDWLVQCRRELMTGTGNTLAAEMVEREFVFVHVPKTGGISILNHLAPGVEPHGHPLARDYQKLLGQERFRRFFKFAVVRNPWDRLVSTFCYLKQGGRNERDRQWSASHLAPYPDFHSFATGWLTRRTIHTYDHFLPQFRFVCDRHGQLLVDHICRLEHLATDYEPIRQRLRPDKPLPHLNASVREPYQTYYTPRTRAIVADVYREDIARFNYSFED